MAMAQRICVTGAAGLAGRAVVRDLLEHGYEVAATDIAVSEADRFEGLLRADLTDYGQALEALRDAEAVVHLANIPAPGLATPPGHVQHEHDHELQRVPGRRQPRTEPRGVGVERDHAGPAVRRAAAVRAGGFSPLARPPPR